MRNILHNNLTTTPYELAFANENKADNKIELYFTIPIITNPYLEITKQDGTIDTTDVLETNNNIITYELPFDTYYLEGSILIRVIAEDYESEYINLNIPTTLKETDNVIVKLNNNEDTYIIRKITQTKTDEVMSMAQMYTYGNISFTSESYVNDWTSNEDTSTTFNRNISIGDFVCQPEESRILIPAGSAEYIRTYMTLAGSGYVTGGLSLINDDGDRANSLFNHQPGGNSYFIMSAVDRVLKIPDTTKDWYLKMYLAPYNATSFGMNNGYGNRSTYMGVEKILPTNIVQGSTTTTAASNVVIKRW